MLLGVVGRATLASFGSPFFWLDRLVPRLLRVNEYFEDRRQIDPDSRNDRYGAPEQPLHLRWPPSANVGIGGCGRGFEPTEVLIIMIWF